jgi:hypothetical protein
MTAIARRGEGPGVAIKVEDGTTAAISSPASPEKPSTPCKLSGRPASDALLNIHHSSGP